MSARPGGTHLAVMLGPPENAPIWKAAFVRDLEEWAVLLEPGSAGGSRIVRVNTDGDLYGIAWLLDREEACERHPAASFLSYRSTCPFIADLEPIGFVEWLEIGDAPRSRWLVPLIKEGKGLIVGLERKCMRSAVVERSFSLDNLVSRVGFEDGDVLLTRDLDALGDYRYRTAQAIERTLAEHGFAVHLFGPEGTIHNPFRVGSALLAKGKVIENEAMIARMLAPLQTTIWAYNFDLVRDTSMFP